MIPVFILTGFLGSGKTTLLRRLLRDPAMGRTAVIVNEFGEIGIDHELVEAGSESVVQLASGCLCCKVVSDLGLTLADLARRRAAGSVPRFEQVVIETSGLADPVPILHALMRGGPERDYLLGAIVTTVDAVLGVSALEHHEVSRRQVAMADSIVLTKSDLADARMDEARAGAMRLNADATFLVSRHGELSGQALFHASNASAVAAAGRAWVAGGQDARPSLFTDHGAQAGRKFSLPADSIHDPGISSLCLTRREPLHAATLALFFEALADHYGSDLLRMKGIVQVVEHAERPAVIHGVQHLFHAPQWLERWPSPDHCTRLVFIGRNLSRVWISTLLDFLDSEVADETARRSAAPDAAGG